MIVNYLPAMFAAAKNQRESTMGLVVGALEVPAADYNRCITAQECGFEIGKGKRPHFFTRVVVSLVPVENGLPPARDAVAGNKTVASE